ncbi:hypothetical protein RHS01_08918 [Rhizoctonia solani]|uniref:Uncharacterized protein n=1 Tax=Rhizoctonia solani TaxID=456999 RepID=A0A8H7M1B9_9AGAM|nr:hypothetical protein RHS01_08918 [Rhizoctonia solani]
MAHSQMAAHATTVSHQARVKNMGIRQPDKRHEDKVTDACHECYICVLGFKQPVPVFRPLFSGPAHPNPTTEVTTTDDPTPPSLLLSGEQAVAPDSIVVVDGFLADPSHQRPGSSISVPPILLNTMSHVQTHTMTLRILHMTTERTAASRPRLAKELGAENVPSMYALQKCDQKLANLMGDMTQRFTTQKGDIYYVNDIGTMLKQDFSNMNLRKNMEFYPRELDGSVSEIWHGEKMLKGDNQEQLTPMTSYSGQSYVYQVARELSARGYRISPHPELGQDHFVYSSQSPLSLFQAFRKTCVQLRSSHPNGVTIVGDPIFVSITEQRGATDWLQSHPLRELAAGREVYSIPFILFVDDVSGNTSKQWNKHWCCYASNAALPRKELNQRSNIRFVSTSQHIDPLEMLNGVCKMFEQAFDKPVVAWDAALGCEVLLRPYIHVISGDNPMQAIECSTCGLLSNFCCRTCLAGGQQKYKRSDEGFATLMRVGTLRTPNNTIESIDDQYKIAFTSNPTNRLALAQRKSGVKDTIAQSVFKQISDRRQELEEDTTLSEQEITLQLQREFKSKSEGPGRMNPLLSLKGFNVHLDTPTETLHTILLGVVKYLWTETTQNLDKSGAFSLFSTRFQAVSVSGLNCGPVPAYITNNRGSLNGKHFKLLVQTASFCLHDLVPIELIHTWSVLGRLAVLAWYPSIGNLDSYEQELQQAINDFLHMIARTVPALIIQKAKPHLLVHMPLFARRFGPLLGPSSERYESFNSTFRAASVHSNRQAPSRDIARTFALFDVVKHVMSGGTWYDSKKGGYIHAGSSIFQLRESSPLTNRLLGVKKQAKPFGTANVLSSSVSLSREQLIAQGLEVQGLLTTSTIYPAMSFAAQNGDKITSGSNIIFTKENTTCPVLGKVRELFADGKHNGTALMVTVQIYDWVELDCTVRMPAVCLTNKVQAISGLAVICEANLQHRCAYVGCMDTGSAPILQERQQTGMMQATLKHNDKINFIVNILSFHNCIALRKLCEGQFGCYDPLIALSEYSKIQQDGAAAVRNSKKPQDAKLDDQESNIGNSKQTLGLSSVYTEHVQTHTHYSPSTSKPKVSGRLGAQKRKRGKNTDDANGHVLRAPSFPQEEPLAPYVPPTLFS